MEPLRRKGRQLWQGNYYEHIIGNDDALHRIWQYIASNPDRMDAGS